MLYNVVPNAIHLKMHWFMGNLTSVQQLHFGDNCRVIHRVTRHINIVLILRYSNHQGIVGYDHMIINQAPSAQNPIVIHISDS